MIMLNQSPRFQKYINILIGIGKQFAIQSPSACYFDKLSRREFGKQSKRQPHDVLIVDFRQPASLVLKCFFLTFYSIQACVYFLFIFKCFIF